MPLPWSQHAENHEEIWHRRGHLGFAGSIALMLVAARVTSSLDRSLVITIVASCAVVVAIAGLLLVSGQLVKRWSLLLWPVATVSTLVAYGQADPRAGGLLIGIIPMAFLHVGLSQPPGRGLWLLLPATAAWAMIVDLDVGAAAIRLPLAIGIWAASSELPARLLTEVRQQKDVLRIAATTDSLTGLLNRSTLAARMQVASAGSSVAVIDIDHFKLFNDTFGHLAGDVVLTDFATMLVEQSGPDGGVFRYGGEEFLVLFDAMDAAEAAVMVELFADAWQAHASHLTFSAGVALLSVDGIRVADDLMYRAKRDGRSRVMVEHRESA
ncbi:MAG: GGDEF domain-containing protein [Aeromicrobium sp.]